MGGHKFYCTCTKCTLLKIYRNIREYKKEIILFRKLKDASTDEFSKDYFVGKISKSTRELRDLIFHFMELNLATEEEFNVGEISWELDDEVAKPILGRECDAWARYSFENGEQDGRPF